MGLRFRRRLSIAKGFYLNVSKTGTSVSLGGRGATLNLSRRGTRTTVGLPGSGLSYRSPTRHWNADQAGTPPPAGSVAVGRIIAYVILGAACLAVALLAL
jgi:hypothetical protein